MGTSWMTIRRILGVSLIVALVASPVAPTAAPQEPQAAGKDPAARSPEFARLYSRIRQHIVRIDQRAEEFRIPDFEKGKEWFNAPPLSFERELRGKVVVLDFWTYCCINCIHVLPDLAYLEEKYAGYPVAFVGVHSAKFDNEKVSENVRQAVLRYEIRHPVINDDEMSTWRKIGVRSWPSLALVGPQGNLLLMVSGEGQRDVLDAAIAATLDFYPKESFRHEPVPLALETAGASSDAPLRYPGKLAVDAKRGQLFISDSNHNRIVVTDLDGRFVEVIGTGRIGLQDGPYDTARFNRLQGLAVDGDLLWVADAENHALRRVDLLTRTVTTVAGNGVQGRDYEGGRSGVGQLLSTPWDVVVDGEKVFIAMAGTHQIWSHDKSGGATSQYSGSGREQNLNSENRLMAAWAQPSGLTIGAGKLFVADSESSTIRDVDLASGVTSTIVGGQDGQPTNLFAFGDVDGKGDAAKLQHALGVLWVESRKSVLVADTYNHRLKILDPAARSVRQWVGSGKSGLADGAGLEARFSEPSGLALAPDGRRVFVADTNNHAIRVVDLETLAVRTLKLSGIPGPAPAAVPRSTRLADLPDTPVVKLPGIRIAAAKETELVLAIRLPAKHHYSKGAGSRWQILADPDSPIDVDEKAAQGHLEDAPEIVTRIRGTRVGATGNVRVEALAYYCEDGKQCKVGAVVFEVPVQVAKDGEARVRLEHSLRAAGTSFDGLFELPDPQGEK